jgi:hypothetical protein
LVRTFGALKIARHATHGERSEWKVSIEKMCGVDLPPNLVSDTLNWCNSVLLPHAQGRYVWRVSFLDETGRGVARCFVANQQEHSVPCFPPLINWYFNFLSTCVIILHGIHPDRHVYPAALGVAAHRGLDAGRDFHSIVDALRSSVTNSCSFCHDGAEVYGGAFSRGEARLLELRRDPDYVSGDPGFCVRGFASRTIKPIILATSPNSDVPCQDQGDKRVFFLHPKGVQVHGRAEPLLQHGKTSMLMATEKLLIEDLCNSPFEIKGLGRTEVYTHSTWTMNHPHFHMYPANVTRRSKLLSLMADVFESVAHVRFGSPGRILPGCFPLVRDLSETLIPYIVHRVCQYTFTRNEDHIRQLESDLKGAVKGGTVKTSDFFTNSIKTYADMSTLLNAFTLLHRAEQRVPRVHVTRSELRFVESQVNLFYKDTMQGVQLDVRDPSDRMRDASSSAPKSKVSIELNVPFTSLRICREPHKCGTEIVKNVKSKGKKGKGNKGKDVRKVIYNCRDGKVHPMDCYREARARARAAMSPGVGSECGDTPLHAGHVTYAHLDDVSSDPCDHLDPALSVAIANTINGAACLREGRAFHSPSDVRKLRYAVGTPFLRYLLRDEDFVSGGITVPSCVHLLYSRAGLSFRGRDADQTVDDCDYIIEVHQKRHFITFKVAVPFANGLFGSKEWRECPHDETVTLPSQSFMALQAPQHHTPRPDQIGKSVRANAFAMWINIRQHDADTLVPVHDVGCGVGDMSARLHHRSPELLKCYELLEPSRRTSASVNYRGPLPDKFLPERGSIVCLCEALGAIGLKDMNLAYLRPGADALIFEHLMTIKTSLLHILDRGAVILTCATLSGVVDERTSTKDGWQDGKVSDGVHTYEYSTRISARNPASILLEPSLQTLRLWMAETEYLCTTMDADKDLFLSVTTRASTASKPITHTQIFEPCLSDFITPASPLIRGLLDRGEPVTRDSLRTSHHEIQRRPPVILHK